MGEKDDGLVGLGLSLGCGENQPPLKESLMQNRPSQNLPNQRSSWRDLFNCQVQVASSVECHSGVEKGQLSRNPANSGSDLRRWRSPWR